MRCLHCAAEIPDASRFCGICGRRVAGGGAATRRGGEAAPAALEASSLSLFELPVSRGARLGRILTVLALDAVLVGAGVAMILSYLGARERARGTAVAAEPRRAAAEVEVLAPAPVRAAAPAEPSAAPAEPTASRNAPASATPAARRPPTESARPAVAPAGREAPAQPGTASPAMAPPGGATPPGQAPAPLEPVAPVERAGRIPPPDEEIQSLAGRIGLEVNRNQGQLQRCYQQAAKTSTPDLPLEGRIDLQFEITAEGRADRVRVVGDTTGSDHLASCVVGLVRSWSFPAPPGGEPLEFVWPFRFRAPK